MLAPGATIGILGGGQLARMLALAGARLGLKAHVFSPVSDDPAFDVLEQDLTTVVRPADTSVDGCSVSAPATSPAA